MLSSLRALWAIPTTIAWHVIRGIWRLLRPLVPHRLRLLLLSDEAEAKAEAHAKRKTVATELLLVRHGQSMHNISSVAQYGDSGADATLFDAPLSSLGEQQVAALAGHAELATAELLIASPLTRAVHTLLGAFPSAPAACPPVEFWPLAAEHLTDSCDIGSGASALAARFPALAKHARALPEVWWYTDDETSKSDAADSRTRYRESGFMEPESVLNARVDALVQAVQARPERVIALFGHSDFFNFLMERHCGVSDYWLENAEVYRVILPPPEGAAA